MAGLTVRRVVPAGAFLAVAVVGVLAGRPLIVAPASSPAVGQQGPDAPAGEDGQSDAGPWRVAGRVPGYDGGDLPAGAYTDTEIERVINRWTARDPKDDTFLRVVPSGTDAPLAGVFEGADVGRHVRAGYLQGFDHHWIAQPGNPATGRLRPGAGFRCADRPRGLAL